MKETFSRKQLNRGTAYVIVHPDEYAIQVSMATKDAVEGYKNRLKQRIRLLLNDNVSIYLLNLAVGILTPPPYLDGFQRERRFYVIPAIKDDPMDAQSTRLRRALAEFEGLRRVVFTGGWRNACLKHTLNHTLAGIPRIRFVEKVTAPLDAQVCFENRSFDITAEIDHAFVF